MGDGIVLNIPLAREVRKRIAWALLLTACGSGGDLVLPSDGEPAAVTMMRGDGASGRAGERLTDSVVVQVLDGRHRPVAGVSVLFTLTDPAPDASISPDSTLSDRSGLASAAIVLGSRVGPQSGEVRVLAPGGGAVASKAFTVTALPSSANGIAAVAGDNQSAPVGSTLPDSLVVQVTDAFGNPIEGVDVAWAADGGGSVSAASVTTGADGRAGVERILGPDAGPERTLASAEGLAGSPVVFLHTAAAGHAARLSAVSGGGQSGSPGEELPDPLVVRVSDADDNPVPGVAITWVIGSGHGSVSPTTDHTGDDGRSSTRWTLGPAAGPNSVSAVVSGVGVVGFDATASQGSGIPTTTRITGDSPDPSAEGQPVTVQVTVSAEGGTPAGNVDVSEGDRGCTITLQAGAGSCTITLGHAGAHLFTARYGGAGGFGSSSDTEGHTVTSQAQASLSVRTQPSASAQSGVAFDRQPVIQLRDGSGHELHIPGVEVRAAIGPGGGTLGGGTGRSTDGDGRASFTDLAISGDPGPRTLSFSANGYGSVTSDPVTLTSPAANGPPSAQDDRYSAREDQRLDQSDPGVLANDTDADGDRLRAEVETGPAHGSLSLDDAGGFEYRPDPDFNGTDGFTYHVSDGQATASASVTVEVRPVNDAPSFRPGGDVQVNADAGSQEVAGWASDISAGPSDEAGQRLGFEVTADHPELFQEQPALSPSGTLSFTPAPRKHGDAIVTVVLHDDGGTADGGVDRSPARSFKIRIHKGH